MVGLAFGIMLFGPILSLSFGQVGWSVGLMFGLVVGMRIKEQITTSEPKYANLRWRGRAKLLAHFLAGFVSDRLALGLVVGVLFALVGPLALGLTIGLAGGLMFGLVRGLNAWMETSSITDRPCTPCITHRSDRAVTVIQTSLVALGLGFVVGLATVMFRELVIGIAAGLAAMMLSGLIYGAFGLTAGGRAWLYYAFAARLLAVTGRLPWRLMGFLDDAYRLGLLRMVGPAYQFRHAELQDHLAGTRTTLVR